MIKNILIVDVETTGLNPDKDDLIEVGALLFNLEHKVVLQTWSTLLYCENNPVQHINNINPLWTHSLCLNNAFIASFQHLVDAADCIVAHNAQFDKGFLLHPEIIFACFIPVEKPWVCTRNDFPWPVNLTGRKLQDVCRAMGVPYINAHRSLADCQFLVDCFVKIPDLQERFNTIVKVLPIINRA
jgi:DNA polymerase-3 subunit epsilon